MYEPPPILAPLLFAPGTLYEAIARVRNRMYSMGILPSHRLPAPVISIGNLTLGGSGKTPAVIYTSTVVRDAGETPVVLSRGYGRRVAQEVHVVQPQSKLNSPARELGDEPALIRRRVPGIWMGISADRYRAGLRILCLRKDVVFILDDAFQHRQLHRDLNLLVIDQSQPFLSNRVFPRGSLREPLSGLKRADVIILNGPPSCPSPGEIEATLQRLHPSAKLFHCSQQVQCLIPYETWRREASESVCMPVSAYLVAAVGNARRFRDDVERTGVAVKGGSFRRDHVRITPQHWAFCARQAARTGAEAIVTTEKDAIKMTRPPDFPLLVAVQKISMAETEEFESVLKTAIHGVNSPQSIFQGER